MEWTNPNPGIFLTRASLAHARGDTQQASEALAAFDMWRAFRPVSDELNKQYDELKDEVLGVMAAFPAYAFSDESNGAGDNDPFIPN